MFSTNMCCVPAACGHMAKRKQKGCWGSRAASLREGLQV